MITRSAHVRLLAGIMLLCLPAISFALEIEKLLMPGPVAQAHADIEAECTSCHLPFKKDVQSHLCSECHDDISRDIFSGEGYHGKDPQVANHTCSTCHTEHEGRHADILGLNIFEFDHRLTDFQLIGAHVELECHACHDGPDRYREAPHECVDCHREDDPHQGELGSQCADCHDSYDWLQVNFDHADTGFDLHGAHADTDCLSCHEDQRFQNTPNDCNSCHADDDPHLGHLGNECESCHVDTDWQSVSFDHDDTGFVLLGAHSLTDCLACHVDQTYQGAPDECHVCHEKDDVHKGQNGTDCQQCHNETDWEDTSFDHARDTRFELDGAHRKLECGNCHTDDPFSDELPMTCVSCHQDDDVHEGRNGTQCADCHVTDNWEESTFDHDTETRFWLRGKHQDLGCADCHVESAHEVKLEMACIACHEDDDVHDGLQGTQCNECHNESSWSAVQDFNHDFSRFPLLGKHQDVECSDCHESQVFHDASTDCIDCHREDDYHDGRFGAACDHCHNPIGWDFWLFDHDTQTGFPLTGAHKDSSCESCHIATAVNSMKLPQTCVSCHQQDDVHDGEFGDDCQRCHVTSTFLEIREID